MSFVPLVSERYLARVGRRSVVANSYVYSTKPRVTEPTWTAASCSYRAALLWRHGVQQIIRICLVLVDGLCLWKRALTDSCDVQSRPSLKAPVNNYVLFFSGGDCYFIPPYTHKLMIYVAIITVKYDFINVTESSSPCALNTQSFLNKCWRLC